MYQTQFYDGNGRPFVRNVGPIIGRMLNGVKHALQDMEPDFSHFHPNVDMGVLRAVVAGKKGPTPEIIEALDEHGPLRVRDLYTEQNKRLFPIVDDTTDGIIIYTTDQRKETERRSFRGEEGNKNLFYTYADTAMSKTSLFRPEWIAEHYTDSGEDPENMPDWAFNKGHFEHQMTYFIGPVNFHWKGKDGRKYVQQMNTGDTNYIIPFVPHSFSTRKEGEGLILAVTYGGAIATEAFQSRIGKMTVDDYLAQIKKDMITIDGTLPTDPNGVIINSHKSDGIVTQLIGNIPFQPDPRVLEILVQGEHPDHTNMVVGAERWGNNIGQDAISLNSERIEPGDSVFIMPGVKHSLSGKGNFLFMEIMPEGNDLEGEIALIERHSGIEGISRIHSEHTQWF